MIPDSIVLLGLVASIMALTTSIGRHAKADTK